LPKFTALYEVLLPLALSRVSPITRAQVVVAIAALTVKVPVSAWADRLGKHAAPKAQTSVVACEIFEMCFMLKIPLL
jgi:hypothetical protein